MEKKYSYIEKCQKECAGRRAVGGVPGEGPGGGR